MKKNYEIVVIGAGAGGLVVAIGSAKAGKKVLLIEKGPYGGDCTNFGCIPSKSLIASAHSSHSLTASEKMGIELKSKSFLTDKSLARVRAIISEIRSHEDPEALKKAGVETITGKAHFVAPGVLEVNDDTITGDHIVIATGSSPFIPFIEGLKETPFLTNETLFDLEKIPESLCVVGGGPIGCELAAAFQRLGSKVSLVHNKASLLDKEEPEAQSVIQNAFEKEGIKLYLETKLREVQFLDNTYHLTLAGGEKLQSEKLLISTGRRANVKGLNLENGAIEYTDKGIKTDRYGRTTSKKVWAVGDVVGPPFFTHWAENQARSVLTSLLIPFFKKRINADQVIPRVTFTDPEIASIGLSEEEAKKKYTIAVYQVPFSSVDRAITAGREEGFIKVVTKKWSSRILGCTIVGPRAGEMLGEISVAMMSKIPLRKLATIIHPYPTYNQAIRKVSDKWLTETILPLFKRKK